MTRARRALRGLALAAGVGVGGLVALVLGLQTEAASRWLAELVAEAAGGLLGEDVVLAGVQLEPLSASVRLEGVLISHRSDNPEHHGAVIAAAEAVAVGLGWRDGRPSLGHLSLERPAVVLHQDEDGLRELRGFELELGEDRQRFPWDELWVHGGSLQVITPKAQVRISGIDISPDIQVDTNRLMIDLLDVRAGEIRQTARAIDVRRIAAGPWGVRVPRLYLRTEDLLLDTGIEALRGGGVHGSIRAEVDLNLANGALPPHLGTAGVVRLTGILDGTPGDIRAEGGLALAQALLLRKGADGEPLDPMDFSGIRTAWRFQDRVLSLGPMEGEWGGGELSVQADIDVATRGASLVVDGRGLTLREVFRLLGVHPHAWVDLDGDLHGVLAGTLQPLRLAGSVELATRRFRVDTGPADTGQSRILYFPKLSLSGQLDIVDRDVFIRADRLWTPTSSASATALLALGPDPHFDIRGVFHRLHFDEIQPLGGVELEGTMAGNIRVAGPAGLLTVDGALEGTGFALQGFALADEVRADVNTPDLRNLHITNFQARKGQTDWRGEVSIDFGTSPQELQLSAWVPGGRLSDLIDVALEVPGLDAAVTASATLAGPWNRMTGPIRATLQDVDLFGEPFERGRFDGAMHEGFLFIDRLRIARDNDTAGILARGQIGEQRRLNLDVHSSGLRIDTSRLAAKAQLPMSGLLSFDAHIGGTLTAPAPSGRVALRNARWKGRRLEAATLYFDTVGDQLRFEGPLFGPALGVQGRLSLNGDASYALRASMNALELDPVLPLAEDGQPYHARFDGNIDLEGVFGESPTVSSRLARVELGWGSHLLQAPRPWKLRYVDDTLILDDVNLEGGETSVVVSGTFSPQGDDVAVDGTAEVDLDLLRAVVPGMERATGLAQVEAAVRLEQGRPVPVVEVGLSNASFKGDWFSAAFEGVSGRLVARPDGYAFHNVKGRLGGGTWDLKGGIEARRWRPTRFGLSAQVDNARVRYLDFLPPIQGDASLTFDGPSDELLLGGTIDIEDLVFAERIDWEDWVLEFSGDHLVGASEETTTDLFDLDLQVTADKTARFRNNVGDLVASADLRFVGDTARPGLTGNIVAEPGGRVLLKEREFELRRAEMRFVDPYAFDPELDFVMQTDVRTRENEYTIDYRVLGPYSDWRTETRSDPALPQADINSLLLFGLTTEEMARYGGAAGALAVEGGDLLASKFGIVERVGQGVYGLEFVRPERIDLVSGVSERGSGTVSSELRLLVEKDIDWGTLIFEQNLSRAVDTYIGFEKRLARLFYLRTYWGRDQVGRRLDIGGAYGLELKIRTELD